MATVGGDEGRWWKKIAIADLLQAAPNQPRVPYSQVAYMPNGAPSGPSTGATSLLPNQSRIIQQGPVRVLCIADVRGMSSYAWCVPAEWMMADGYAGNLRSLNDLAREARANYIIHTGDFGFYDDRSLDRIAEKYVYPFFPFSI